MTSIEDLEKKLNDVTTNMKTRDAIIFDNRKDVEDQNHEFNTMIPMFVWVFALIIAGAIGFFIGCGTTVSQEKAILAANNATVLIQWITGVN